MEPGILQSGDSLMEMAQEFPFDGRLEGLQALNDFLQVSWNPLGSFYWFEQDREEKVPR